MKLLAIVLFHLLSLSLICHAKIILITTPDSYCSDPSSNLCSLSFHTDDSAFRNLLVSNQVDQFPRFLGQVVSTHSLNPNMVCELIWTGGQMMLRLHSTATDSNSPAIATCQFILNPETYLKKSSSETSLLSFPSDVVYVGNLFDDYQIIPSDDCNDQLKSTCNLTVDFPISHLERNLILHTSSTLSSIFCRGPNPDSNINGLVTYREISSDGFQQYILSLSSTPLQVDPYNPLNLTQCAINMTKTNFPGLSILDYSSQVEILKFDSIASIKPLANHHIGSDCLDSSNSICTILYEFDKDQFERMNLDDVRQISIQGFSPATHSSLVNGWKYDSSSPKDPMEKNSCPKYYITTDNASPNQIFPLLTTSFWDNETKLFKCVVMRKTWRFVGDYIVQLSSLSTGYSSTLNLSQELREAGSANQIVWDNGATVHFEESTCDSSKLGTDPDSPFCKITFKFNYQGPSIQFEFNSLPSYQSRVEYMKCNPEISFIAPASFVLKPLAGQWLEYNEKSNKFGDGSYWCEIWIPKYQVGSKMKYTNLYLQHMLNLQTGQFNYVDELKYRTVFDEPSSPNHVQITHFDFKSLFTVSYTESNCNNDQVERCTIIFKQSAFYNSSLYSPESTGIYSFPYNIIKDIMYIPSNAPNDISNAVYSDYNIEITGFEPGSFEYDGNSPHIILPYYNNSFTNNQISLTNPDPTNTPSYWFPTPLNKFVIGYMCSNSSKLDPENYYFSSDRTNDDCKQSADYVYEPPAKDYLQTHKDSISDTPSSTHQAEEVNAFARTPQNETFPWIWSLKFNTISPNNKFKWISSSPEEVVTYTFRYRKMFPIETAVFAQFIFKGFAGVIVPDEEFEFDLTGGTTHPMLHYSPNQAMVTDGTGCGNPYVMDCQANLTRKNETINTLYYFADVSTMADVNERFVPFMEYKFQDVLLDPAEVDNVALNLLRAYGLCPNTTISVSKKNSLGEFETVERLACVCIKYIYGETDKRLENEFRIYKLANFHGLVNFWFFDPIQLNPGDYEFFEEDGLDKYIDLANTKMFSRYVSFIADGMPQFQPNCANTISPICTITYKFNSFVEVAGQYLIKHWLPDSNFIQSETELSCINLKSPNTVETVYETDPFSHQASLSLTIKPVLNKTNPMNPSETIGVGDFVPIDPTKPIECSITLFKLHHDSPVRSLAKSVFPQRLFVNTEDIAPWNPRYNLINVPRMGYSVFKMDGLDDCYTQGHYDGKPTSCTIRIQTRASKDYPFQGVVGPVTLDFPVAAYPVYLYEGTEKEFCSADMTENCNPQVGLTTVTEDENGDRFLTYTLLPQYKEVEDLVGYAILPTDNSFTKIIPEVILKLSVIGGNWNEKVMALIPQETHGVLFSTMSNVTYAYPGSAVRIDYFFNAETVIHNVTIDSDFGVYNGGALSFANPNDILKLPCLEKPMFDETQVLSAEEYQMLTLTPKHLWTAAQNSTVVAFLFSDPKTGKTHLVPLEPQMTKGKTCYVLTVINSRFPNKTDRVRHTVEFVQPLDHQDYILKPLYYVGSYPTYFSALKAASTKMTRRSNEVRLISEAFTIVPTIQQIILLFLVSLLMGFW